MEGYLHPKTKKNQLPTTAAAIPLTPIVTDYTAKQQDTQKNSSYRVAQKERMFLKWVVIGRVTVRLVAPYSVSYMAN